MNTAATRPFTHLGLVVALVAVVGCGPHDAELAEADLAPVRVRLATVERFTEPEAIEVRGTVQPTQQAFLSSRAVGPVVAVRVHSGDAVAAGQTLVQIQPEASDGQLAQATGALAQARAALALAERNYQRYLALHAEKAASELELDMARMQLEQAQGAVAQAAGAVQSADSVASESTVSAPFSGLVVKTLVEVGDLAAPGRPLVQLESGAGRQIWLTVREGDIHRLSVGDGVPVRIDSRPELGTLAGAIREIVPSADPATHTFTVKVDLGRIDIPTGLSGRATIPGDAADRLLAPVEAVHRRGGLELVVVRSESGEARTRAVTTGDIVGDGRFEVLSGLAEGDQVALDLPAPVADGTPLEVAR
ncbi:MAG: efflux RND transporter periplasmic adaptor subunit [Thermoanaerobaculales bacterium]|jgi:RND family efflux transporter MFP subunit|nr:efflux RND transporter periplasmic adaptor subunit [Thermoanaerobaculales bacterium]